MAIDPGRMRHRITFQRRTEDRDQLGGDTGEWEDVKTVWAAVTPLSAKEVVNQVREVLVTHKILCRYVPDIDQTMRIAWSSRIFRIVSIIDYDEVHADMTIMAEEATNGRQF